MPYHIEGSIIGVADILFNRYHEVPGEKKTSSRKSEEQRMKDAENAIYKDDFGVYIPAWNFKACIMNGATREKIKYGKGSITPYLYASIFPEDLRLNRETHDYMDIHMGRVPPRTGGYVAIYRPAIKMGWTGTFRIGVTDDRISAEDIEQALVAAGTHAGLGAWRPQYGRFIVQEFQAIESES